MIHGAVLVDKPSGITSHDVVHAVRKNFSLKKVGHAGTLDPLATGLLVVLLGKATRLQSLFLELNKAYEGEILLGRATDTDDVTGAVIEEHDVMETAWFRNLEATARDLEQQFCGEIMQRPPAYSAVKVDGRRSYALARKGVASELQERAVQIEELALEFLEPSRLRYRMSCSKGTYVRSLARDIGESLGVGGCVESIRRTRSGDFSVAQAISLEDLKAAESLESHLHTQTELVADLPKIPLSTVDCERLRLGNQEPLKAVSIAGEQQIAAIVDKTGVFVGLAEHSQTGPDWRVKFLV